MIIAPYIVSKEYICSSELSFSFIFDARYKLYYVLKGEISSLWGYILSNSHSEEEISRYAKTLNIDSELYNFIAELKERQIILTDKDYNFTGYKYLVNIVNEKDEKSFDVFYDGFQKLIKKNHILNSVIIQLGYKCNLKCKHCFNPKNKNEEELSFDIVKRFIDEAYKLGTVNVTLTGGECTYSKNFLEIAKYIRKKHLFLSFLTNAQMLADDDYFDEIISLYPYQLRISLYSMNPEVHDSITNLKGSHNKTLKVIKKLRERNIEVMLHCPVLNINKNDYLDVINFAKSIGAESGYTPYFIDNIDNKNSYLKLSQEELEEYFFNEISSGRSSVIEYQKDDKCMCGKRQNNLCIMPNAKISLCNDFNYYLGDFNTTSLEEIWNNVAPQTYQMFTRNNLKDCFKHDYCKYCEYCPKCALFDAKLLGKSQSLCLYAQARYNAVKKYENLKKG